MVGLVVDMGSEVTLVLSKLVDVLETFGTLEWTLGGRGEELRAWGRGGGEVGADIVAMS